MYRSINDQQRMILAYCRSVRNKYMAFYATSFSETFFPSNMENFISRQGQRRRLPTSIQERRDHRKHPFRPALVKKEDIRAFEQPASAEHRTNLQTTFWLQKALADLPQSHPSQRVLEERLRSEPTTPIGSSVPPFPLLKARTRPYTFLDLPREIRNTIYKYSALAQEPVSPVLDTCDQPRRTERQVKTTSSTGLLVLEEVFPGLKPELDAMLPTFYRSNTFQFDLRSEKGCNLLRRWIREKGDEASGARKIRLKHWTWWFNDSGEWECAADETILALLPTGFVELKRLAQLPGGCSCGMEEFLGSHCPDWKINKLWSLTDFVKAVREDEELLIQALVKFLEIVQQHDDNFHLWRENPTPCQQCGKQMMLLRSLDTA